MSAPAQRSVFRGLLDLSLPVIGLNVLNVLALAVDTAMLGRLENQEIALTGLGFATQLIFLLMVAMIGVTVGTVASIARAWGANQKDRVNHILAQSIQLTILVALAVAGPGNLLAPYILDLLGASGEIKAAALTYLRPLLAGVVFSYLNILFGAALRGVGNTRLPFVIALIYNGLNVVLNYGLILGNYGLPAMGIQGAAIGTLVSYAVAVVLMVILLRRGIQDSVTIQFSWRPFDRGLVKSLIAIGAPAGADMLVLNAAFLSIVGMLGRVDPLAVAAHGIGLRIQALAFVPGMSISQATGAMVGQALGAGDVDRANAVVKAAMVLCTGIMSTLGFLIISQAGLLVSIFEVDPNGELGQFAITWMRLLGFLMPVVGVYISITGMLQGAGATRTSLRINAVTTFVGQIPASWILGFPLGLGAFGIWLAFPLTFVAKMIWGLIAWKKGDWATTGGRLKRPT